MREEYRQGIHIGVGLAFIALALILGRAVAIAVNVGLILFIMLFVGYRYLGHKTKPLEDFLGRVERPHGFPAKGSLEYAAGMLFAFLYAPSLNFALATIAILAVGDGLSTIIGRGSPWPLPWNKKKSWHGLAAFVIFGFWASLAFLGWQSALLYSIVLGLVETIPWNIDDNLSIPIIMIALGVLLK